MLEPVRRLLPETTMGRSEEKPRIAPAPSVMDVAEVGAPLVSALHVREFRGRQAQRACPCRRARRVAENNAVMQGCNPLFLYGGVGLGKTHLMHAIAWHIRRTAPSRKVIYLSAEKFIVPVHPRAALQGGYSLQGAVPSVDVLMIDDVQFISGKDSTPGGILHTPSMRWSIRTSS